MTQEVDSAAGSLINAQTGASGVDAESQTLLDDGNVSQVLQYADSSRRALTPFLRGQFDIVLENDHAIASSLESFVDPYNPVNVHNGFPASIDPNKFDIWVLHATAHTNLGPNMDHALLGRDAQALHQAESDTAAGGPASTIDRREILGLWNNWVIEAVGTEFGRNSLTNAFRVIINRRWTPNESILFRSISTDTAVATCIVSCYIGPVGLGQDAV